MKIRQQKKITLISTKKPVGGNINQELQWLGNSLGLFNLRDKDKSCFRTFIELIKCAKLKRAISSEELAYRLNLSRATVIHHINKLMEAGIVIHEGNRYMLRVDNLFSLINEIEKDIKRICEEIKEIARNIDKKIGL